MRHSAPYKRWLTGVARTPAGGSSDAKTPEGRRAIAEATPRRMVSEQLKRVLKGICAWLKGAYRKIHFRLAKARERRKRLQRLMLE